VADQADPYPSFPSAAAFIGSVPVGYLVGELVSPAMGVATTLFGWLLGLLYEFYGRNNGVAGILILPCALLILAVSIFGS
jgi:hypothetical protein